MPAKNLYVSPRDEELWNAAERLADLHKISLSRFVTDALETHVPKVAAEPTPAPSERWADIAACKPEPEAQRA